MAPIRTNREFAHVEISTLHDLAIWIPEYEYPSWWAEHIILRDSIPNLNGGRTKIVLVPAEGQGWRRRTEIVQMKDPTTRIEGGHVTVSASATFDGGDTWERVLSDPIRVDALAGGVYTKGPSFG